MTSPSTSALTELLARVRGAAPGENGEAERLEIARDWCKLWIGRDDYPEIAYLITNAFSEIKASLGSAVAFAERVLPGMRAQLVFGGGEEPHATMLMADGPPTQRAATPALAMIAATLASLTSKENEG